MSQNPQDAAPKRGNGKRLANGGGTAVSADQVAAYLRDHPDFLRDNPDVLDVLTPPARSCGDGVADLQQFLVEKLRRDVTDMAAARDALVTTGRSNLAAQARVHKAILALLAARSFEHFIETLTTDLAIVLDLDVVVIGVEQTADGPAKANCAGVMRLAPNMVDKVLGPGQNIALRADVDGDAAIFGAGAGLVQSDALIRLSIGRTTPAALLALGSRDSDHFQPGQGTELLNFLARVVEISIRGWLNLPE
jgi:uncharacterized protein YigA (DUF484 family)